MADFWTRSTRTHAAELIERSIITRMQQFFRHAERCREGWPRSCNGLARRWLPAVICNTQSCTQRTGASKNTKTTCAERRNPEGQQSTAVQCRDFETCSFSPTIVKTAYVYRMCAREFIHLSRTAATCTCRSFLRATKTFPPALQCYYPATRRTAVRMPPHAPSRSGILSCQSVVGEIPSPRSILHTTYTSMNIDYMNY